MKGTLKIITILFAVALFAVPSAAAFSSSAEDDKPAVDPNAFVSYYAQLDANGKAVYDALNSAEPDLTTLKIEFPIKITAKADDPETAKEFVFKAAKKTVDDAFVALRLSSPRAYLGWDPTSVVPIQYGVDVSGNTATALYATLNISYSSYPVDPKTGVFQGIQKMLDDLDAAVEKYTVKGTTDYEKVSNINSYLINLVTYDPNYGKRDDSGKPVDSRYNHDAYGALVSPHLAVCDGYSKAFVLLCEKAGVESVVGLGTGMPSGESHAWNYVKVDGKWYGIDVTWNDTNDNAYFLKGKEFFATHLPGIYIDLGYPTDPFQIPALNSTSYDTDQRAWYLDYAWVLAIAIAGVIVSALYIHSRRGKP